MRDDEVGSRIGIVMNGSPLFTGGAGSAESEIRRWMLENDWVEAIVALPTDLFYNTGIQTYVWLLTNRKPAERRGKVQLIDASGERFWSSLRRALGDKRREIPSDGRDEIVRIYASFLHNDNSESAISKVFDIADFGYREVRVERPLRLNFCANDDRVARLEREKAFSRLEDDDKEAIYKTLDQIRDEFFQNRDLFSERLSGALTTNDVSVGAPVKKAILSALSERDEKADICTDRNGNPEPDRELRDHELVPLDQDWQEFVAREVTPFAPDAWVDVGHTDAQDGEVGRLGYEINFNRYFYRYVPPRPLQEIDSELRSMEAEIADLLKDATA